MVKAVVVVGAEVTFWVDGAVWVGVSVDPCKGFFYMLITYVIVILLRRNKSFKAAIPRLRISISIRTAYLDKYGTS